ncbi:hypothetical protein HBH43_110440 [Parastagonospora nodorum]|nr:hypothetical protein HBH43_110440 [Parastagonospora nodorum]
MIGRYCNTFGPEDQDQHQFVGSFLAQGADWIVALGSQITKLSRLLLEINGLCTPFTQDNCIEVLPLLRVLWSRRWSGKIEFTASSGLSSQRYPCQLRKRGEIGEVLHVSTANKILDSLLRDNDIRKYERLLSHVVIRRNGTGGIALFRSTGQPYCPKGATHAYHYIDSGWRKFEPCLEHRMDFQLDRNRCQSLTRPLPNLVNLDTHRQRRHPYTHLQRRIFDYILRHDETQLVDLNIKSKSSAPGLLYVNRFIHNDENSSYYTENYFAVHLRFRTNPLQVVDTENLSRWLSISDTRYIPERMILQSKHNVNPLYLDFESLDGRALYLEDIRIRTKRLVYRGNWDDVYPIVVRIRDASHHQSSNDDVPVEAKFALNTVRIDVTRARSELQKAGVYIAPYGRDDNVDVIINGRGRPVGYIWLDDTLDPPKFHPMTLQWASWSDKGSSKPRKKA